MTHYLLGESSASWARSIRWSTTARGTFALPRGVDVVHLFAPLRACKNLGSRPQISGCSGPQSWHMASASFLPPQGPAGELGSPDPARSLTLSAGRRILHRTSVIIIYVFTRPALCKGSRLSEPSPSADLSVSELGQEEKSDAGRRDNNQKYFVHPMLHACWWWLRPGQVLEEALREGPGNIISCYANRLFE